MDGLQLLQPVALPHVIKVVMDVKLPVYAEIEGGAKIMSQQMDFEETNRQQQAPRFDNYDAGYRDPFAGSYTGQKLSPQAPTSSGGVSAGMRLALAIVSLCLLVPIAAIVLGISSGVGPFGLVGG